MYPACRRKWHPDRNPDNVEKAEQKFREVQLRDSHRAAMHTLPIMLMAEMLHADCCSIRSAGRQ